MDEGNDRQASYSEYYAQRNDPAAFQIVFRGVISEQDFLNKTGYEGMLAYYGLDEAEVRSSIGEPDGYELKIKEAVFQEGAPGQGWVLEFYRAAQPVIHTLADLATIGLVMSGVIHAARRFARKKGLKERPRLSPAVIEAINVFRFMRHRCGIERYKEVNFRILNQSVDNSQYRENDVYMLSISKSTRHNPYRTKMYVRFVDCTGRVMGKTKYRIPIAGGSGAYFANEYKTFWQFWKRKPDWQIREEEENRLR